MSSSTTDKDVNGSKGKLLSEALAHDKLPDDIDMHDLIEALSLTIKKKKEGKDKEGEASSSGTGASPSDINIVDRSKSKGKEKESEKEPFSMASIIQGIVDHTEKQAREFEAIDEEKRKKDDEIKQAENELNAFLSHSLIACAYDPEAHGYEGRFIVYKNAIKEKFPTLCVRPKERKDGSWCYLLAMACIMAAFFVVLQSPLVQNVLSSIGVSGSISEHILGHPHITASIMTVIGLFAFAEAKSPSRGFIMTLQMTPRSRIEPVFSVEDADGRFPGVDAVLEDIRRLAMDFKRKAD